MTIVYLVHLLIPQELIKNFYYRAQYHSNILGQITHLV